MMELDVVNSNSYQGNNKGIAQAVDKVEIASVSSISGDKVKVSTDDSRMISNLKNIKSDEIKKSVSEINSKLNKNTEAVFGIHDETNHITIKIIDKDSKEVIKEIPPEKTLEMIAKVWEIAGLLVDEKL